MSPSTINWDSSSVLVRTALSSSSATSDSFLTGPYDTNGSKQRENAFIPLIVALWTICAFHPVTCFMVSNDAPNLTQASVKNRAQFGDIFDTVPVL